MPTAVMDLSQQQLHLQKVSRTFALTIPLLPQDLCDYISNAYLICRIADTVEDDPVGPPEQKSLWLKRFAAFARSGFAPEEELASLHASGVALVEKGAVPAELALLADMQAVLRRTLTYPEAVRSIIAHGVSILACGMARSVKKGFEIKSVDDVDGYCYFVAGVVGEMLAALFASSDRRIDSEKLLNLSVSFGEGLQLTNILKDQHQDQQREARYLPKVSGKAGECEEIIYYTSICQGHLQDALDFILLIPRADLGVRRFCFLNIAMAAATLKKICACCGEENAVLKISRRSVKILYVLCGFCSRSNVLTRMLFRLLSLKNPCIRRDFRRLREKVSWWDKPAENILTDG